MIDYYIELFLSLNSKFNLLIILIFWQNLSLQFIYITHTEKLLDESVHFKWQTAISIHKDKFTNYHKNLYALSKNQLHELIHTQSWTVNMNSYTLSSNQLHELIHVQSQTAIWIHNLQREIYFQTLYNSKSFHHMRWHMIMA